MKNLPKIFRASWLEVELLDGKSRIFSGFSVGVTAADP
jgi:hypothetical protein